MRDTCSRCDLVFGDAHIVEQLGPLEQGLVLGGVHQHCGTPTVLGEDYGALGALNVTHHGRQMRSEIGEGTDILGGSQSGHGALTYYVQ
jgi:hypothetical protein